MTRVVKPEIHEPAFSQAFRQPVLMESMFTPVRALLKTNSFGPASLLFHQVLRTHYLIVQGFHVLADNKLTTDEWRKIRVYAKERGDYFAQQALAEFQKRGRAKAVLRSVTIEAAIAMKAQFSATIRLLD
jgi:hypothetical protein